MSETTWRADEFHRLADLHSIPQSLIDEAKAKAREARGVSPVQRGETMSAQAAAYDEWRSAVLGLGDPMPFDPGIRRAVEVLQAAGIETFESCEGGPRHAFPEPTVRFHGDRSEGFRAYAAAAQVGLPVSDLQRVWPVVDGELTGPWWELTFCPEERP